MRLEQIDIRNFRNHERTVLECGDGLNVLLGENGQGKTNVVEAVAYLSLTKSFYASSDAVVLRIGEEQFDLQGRFRADGGTRWVVDARYERPSGRKSISINKETAQTLASVVGQFPAVVLSPEQNGITFGAPTERRKFLDLALSQASSVYLEELLEYRRILRQRNKILLDAKLARRDCSELLEPWDISLIQTGADLMLRRMRFIEGFRGRVCEAYEMLAGETEDPSLMYEPSFSCNEAGDPESIRIRFEEELRLHEDEERRAGSTVVGPHRDELDFSLGGKTLRKFASQGQHKTFLIALKLAEFAYLMEARSETPILLLDDVFSELDERRSHRLMEGVPSLGQVFITTTDERFFPETTAWNSIHRRYSIREGRVVNAEAAAIH